MKRRPRRGFGEDGFESRGGYMAAKKGKLKDQFAMTASTETGDGSSEPNQGIFHGVSIFVNGFTTPSADELKRIMMVHGGIYHHYMSQATTHIIATNLPNVKIMKLKVMKVIKPEWIVDSVKAAKLLDFRSYLLYSHQSVTQPRLQFGGSNKTASNDKLGASSSIFQEPPNSATPHKIDEKCGLQADTRKNELNLLYEIKSIHDQQSSSSASMLSTASPKSEKFKNTDKELLCEPASIGITSVFPVNEKATPKPASWSSRTAGEAGFLSEFYNNSRLHHLSTMGATFKQYVNELREKNDHSFPGRDALKEWMWENKDSILEDNAGTDEVDDENFEANTKENDMVKVVMHIDMDCFFVSVGLRSRPELRGLPVAVTHSKGNQAGTNHRAEGSRKAEFEMYKQRLQARIKNPGAHVTDPEGPPSRLDDVDDKMSMSEIASCSYEARKAGIKNGMFMGSALKLCPNLRTIPYDFDAYKQVSYALYDTIARYTLDIEAVSCDELFVDCSKLLKETGAKPLDFASFVRKEIMGKTGCPASTGFGSNMLQARLATRKAKPDGQFLLTPGAVDEFMSAINVADLPGVGRSLSSKLRGLSVQTCKELQQYSLGRLQKELGAKTGESLYRHCRGRDERKLSLGHVRKSVSAEVNYGIRFTSQAEADNFLRQLAGEVTVRLKEVNLKGRCITFKLMVRAKDAPIETAKFMGHGVCDHITKSVTLLQATSDADIIAREVLTIARQLSILPSELRGIGIQVSRLESESKSASGGMHTFLSKNVSTHPTTRVIPTMDKLIESMVSEITVPLCENPVKGTASALNLTIPLELDPAILSELPEDIRQEVLEEYRRKTVTKPVISLPGPSHQYHDTVQPWKEYSHEDELDLNYSQIDSSFLEALPQDLQRELKIKLSRQKQDAVTAIPKFSNAEVKPQEITEPLGPYSELSLQEMRALIKEWVRSETKPESCDVHMLADHFQQLVRTQRLDTVDLLIKCLHRCISAKKCKLWEQAFHDIIHKTQETMLAVYSHKLMVFSQFSASSSSSSSKTETF